MRMSALHPLTTILMDSRSGGFADARLIFFKTKTEQTFSYPQIPNLYSLSLTV